MLFPDLNKNDLPENALAMHMSPDGSKWWVGGKKGMMKEVSMRRGVIVIAILST